MHRQVSVEGRRPAERLEANDTGERVDGRVDPHVRGQRNSEGELFATLRAFVALFVVVHGAHVLPEAKVLVEGPRAVHATEGARAERSGSGGGLLVGLGGAYRRAT